MALNTEVSLEPPTRIGYLYYMGQPFNIVRDGSRILLSGDMRSDDASRLNGFLRTLPEGHYVIEARNATIDPPAVTVWIDAVNAWLSAEHRLQYADSQLAMVLEDDDRYRHSSSVFADGFSPLERSGSDLPAYR